MIRGRIYGEGVGVRKGPPPPSPKMTFAFLIQLEFYKKKSLCGLLVLKSNMGRPWRIYVKLRKNGSFLVVHPLLKKNPRAAPVIII